MPPSVDLDPDHGRGTSQPPTEIEGRRERAQVVIRLASPRGFCAGVERAINAVENALAEHGAPVFVRHEIVHNAHVVARLKAMGAVFVEDTTDAPTDRPIIVSAHGAPQAVFDDLDKRGMNGIDATCPLVIKVHNEARRQIRQGRHVILIGHAGHPEVLGTMGQAPAGSITLVETPEEALSFTPISDALAYVTQTTLSVDDTEEIICILKGRFPDIVGPKTADICYATTNRQSAVKKIAPDCDVFLVVGDPTSSNSNRLVETAKKAGARTATLVSDLAAFDFQLISPGDTVGISSGASAPEELVEGLLTRIAQSYRVAVESISVAEETISFKQPAMRGSR